MRSTFAATCCHAERSEASPSEVRLTGDSSLAFGMTGLRVDEAFPKSFRCHAERSEASSSEVRLTGDSSLAFGMTGVLDVRSTPQHLSVVMQSEAKHPLLRCAAQGIPRRLGMTAVEGVGAKHSRDNVLSCRAKRSIPF